jgi:hypothetical protein
MAKKTNKSATEGTETTEEHPPVVAGAPQEPAKAKEYSFPSKSRCPRCQTTDTQVRSTQGSVQYRVCLRAVCKHKYTVLGKAI